MNIEDTSVRIQVRINRLVPKLKNATEKYRVYALAEPYYDRFHKCDMIGVWAEISEGPVGTFKLLDHIEAYIGSTNTPVDWIVVLKQKLLQPKLELDEDRMMACALISASDLKVRTAFENENVLIETLSKPCHVEKSGVPLKSPPYQNIMTWATFKKSENPTTKVIKSQILGYDIKNEEVRWGDH